MSCDTCGLDDIECRCYIHELEERIEFLEAGVHQLTLIVEAISDYLKEKEDG